MSNRLGVQKNKGDMYSNEWYPYSLWHEIDLSSNLKLSVCCFSDFNLEVKDSFTEIISVHFEYDKQLIDFVESFKK